MSIFKQRSDYFKSLAMSHKLVAHNRMVNGEQRNSFFRMNDTEELIDAEVNMAHFPCVIHYGFNGRYTGHDNAVPKRKLSNALMFLTKVDASSTVDQIEAAYDQAFEVMEDFISIMYHDYINKGSCSGFDRLDLSRFSFYAQGPVGDLLYGWVLQFEDERFASNVTSFDETKWFE